MITDLNQYIEDLMIPVEGGSFMMGNEDKLPFKYKVHEVAIDDFMMAEFTVTKGLYKAVMGDVLIFGKEDDELPLIYINWYDAIEFCNILSEQMDLSPYYYIDKINKDSNNTYGDDFYKDRVKWTVKMNEASNGFRLPTEAEWEYAARGGIHWKDDFIYAGSNNYNEVGWFFLNGGSDLKVGLLKPNQLGIYDMSGNVWEWCWDWHSDYYYEKSPRENPFGPEKGKNRVLRGGSIFDAQYCNSIIDRSWLGPVHSEENVGFRIAQNF